MVIDSRMPQESILRPLSFIIYVNDIPNGAPGLSFILYVDDTSAFKTHKYVRTLNNVINNGLNKLNTWFQTNKLPRNL